MHGRSRVSEGSSRFRTSAACITVMNALQRNAMPADAFFGERQELEEEERAKLAPSARHLLDHSMPSFVRASSTNVAAANPASTRGVGAVSSMTYAPRDATVLPAVA
jgi:hypothetical protein